MIRLLATYRNLNISPTFRCLFLCLFFSTLLPKIGWTQIDSTQIDTTLTGDEAIDQEIEDIVTSVEIDEEVDYTIITDILEDYRNRPLNLNTATKEELLYLPGMNEILVNNLAQYIFDFGELTSVFELQAIKGFSPEFINKILPFISVQEARAGDISPGTYHPSGPSLGEVLPNIRHEFTQRIVFTLEEERGYTDPDTSLKFLTNDLGDTTAIDTQLSTRYQGTPYRSYTRYRARYGQNVSIALTGEKDAGEVFEWDPQNNLYGYDFVSGHIAIKNYGNLKDLVIGDYNLAIGQGVILSKGLGFGKGAAVINSVKMPPRGIQGYSSVNENQFLRGAAAQLAFKKLHVTSFYSSNRLDASANETDTLTNEILQVSSLSLSGLHRTPSEIAKRRSVQETVIGGRIAYKSRTFTLGTTGYVQTYGAPINRTPNAYNQFAFRGDQNFLVGIDFDWVYQNFNFFGEVGRSKSGGMGGVVGFMSALSPTLDLAAVFRHFDKDFHSSKGYTFAERPTALNNETGLYLGVKMKLNPQWTISTYFDQYYFAFNRFGASFPTKGYENLIQVDYKSRRSTLIYARFRSDNKEENGSIFEEGQRLDFIIPTRKNNFRIHFQSALNDQVEIKSRAEFSWFTRGETEKHQGVLIYQDLSWKPGFTFKLTARYAMFDAPDFDARIYAYENDVLGNFSIPPYFRTGSRYYLIANIKATRWLEFWVRFAQTRFHNSFLLNADGEFFIPESNPRNTSLSSLEAVRSNNRSEVKLQMRIKF
ncbi:MAG: helix-hairpin-helix domain-containing protein [Bacteroidota bacterium]